LNQGQPKQRDQETLSQPIAGHSDAYLSFQATREAEMKRITILAWAKKKKRKFRRFSPQWKKSWHMPIISTAVGR
jgi:hypothetical protein